jgi:hypothetical protein
MDTQIKSGTLLVLLWIRIMSDDSDPKIFPGSGVRSVKNHSERIMPAPTQNGNEKNIL